MAALLILDEMDVKTDPFAVCQLHGKCDLAVGRLAGAALHYLLAGVVTKRTALRRIPYCCEGCCKRAARQR
jgi:hypothetical protein